MSTTPPKAKRRQRSDQYQKSLQVFVKMAVKLELIVYNCVYLIHYTWLSLI